MALEAVVFPQDPLINYTSRELYNLLESNWGCFDFGLDRNEHGEFLDYQTEKDFPCGEWNNNSCSSDAGNNTAQCHLNNDNSNNGSSSHRAAVVGRPKRRRTKSRKNKEDIESQRMTHIAVERNRRKQMNEYLSVLRSLMPESYIQRGDQASIIGGAINFVKELEQKLQLLGVQKEMEYLKSDDDHDDKPTSPFSEFFTFHKYNNNNNTNSSSSQSPSTATTTTACYSSTNEAAAGNKRPSAIADIEVTMVESHASLRIRTKRRPKQLLKVVSGLHSLRLTVLHLNVTTVDRVVLYSISVKVEDDCKLTAVDEISSSVYQIFVKIQEELI
ncbi:transcription factor bHLH96-like [Syzygium oleosum]|uniref:transcription factor bHLH96-like n=1 Tax=Syzygium oleosum TaxID=219896 RepID=UPI0011D23610|nr:transcription factor bHLH96-like [Syzygium oleosum]